MQKYKKILKPKLFCRKFFIYEPQALKRLNIFQQPDGYGHSCDRVTIKTNFKRLQKVIRNLLASLKH